MKAALRGVHCFVSQFGAYGVGGGELSFLAAPSRAVQKWSTHTPNEAEP